MKIGWKCCAWGKQHLPHTQTIYTIYTHFSGITTIYSSLKACTLPVQCTEYITSTTMTSRRSDLQVDGAAAGRGRQVDPELRQ